jgi:hypothetical protein
MWCPCEKISYCTVIGLQVCRQPYEEDIFTLEAFNLSTADNAFGVGENGDLQQ